MLRRERVLFHCENFKLVCLSLTGDHCPVQHEYSFILLSVRWDYPSLGRRRFSDQWSDRDGYQKNLFVLCCVARKLPLQPKRGSFQHIWCIWFLNTNGRRSTVCLTGKTIWLFCRVRPWGMAEICPISRGRRGRLLRRLCAPHLAPEQCWRCCVAPRFFSGGKCVQ